MLVGMIPPLAGLANLPAILTYVGSNASTANATSHTFTSESIGTAATDRYIIIGVTAENNLGARTISSVTVGGVSATQVVFREHSTGSFWTQAAIYIVPYPTGTTATIVVNWSASNNMCGIGVWNATQLQSATATNTNSNTSDPLTATLNVAPGGIAIGCAAAFPSGATPITYTWTNMSERHDGVVEGTVTQTGADTSLVNGNSSLSVTCTGSIAMLGRSMVLASFR